MRRGFSQRIAALLPRRRVARSLVTLLVFGLVQVGIPSYTFALPAQNTSGPNITAGAGGCAATVDNNSSGYVGDSSTSNACILIFKQGSNSWTPPVGVTSVWILVIGGGGAGGFGRGGGGGAGGFYENKNYAVTTGQSYSIQVGAGGSASTSVVNAGQQSVFGSTTINGGGGGGSHGDPRPWVFTGSTETRTTGASGGGSGMNYVDYPNGGGPSGVVAVAGVFANAGANSGSTGNDTRNTGGGGGAGGAGVSGSGGNKTGSAGAGITSPDGGAGKASTITGSSTYYAAGGGGAVAIATSEYNGGSTGTQNYSSAPKGVGGSGIGGNGQYPTAYTTGSYVAATAGAANTGSGGGGGGADASAVAGGAGGSGVVIVRWLPPVIASSISDVTVPESQAALFSYSETTVAGVTSTTRQWQYSTDNGSTWLNVVGGTGATTDTYTTIALAITNTGWKFRGSTTIGDGFETTTSYTNVATLTVILDPSGETDTSLTISPSGGYAWAPDAADFDITGSITMEAWVYPTAFAVGDWNTIINKGGAYELGITSSDGINGYYRYGFSGVNGDGSIKMFSGVYTGVKATLNEWHHIAVSRNVNYNWAQFYLDGEIVFQGSVDSVTAGGQIANSSLPFVIGARSSTPDTYTTAFQGKIDSVQIFKEDRSISNIRSDMKSYTSTSATNMVAFYDFNEGGGNTLYNKVVRSTNLTNLTVVGSREWTDAKVVDTATSPTYTVVKFLRSYLTKNNQGWKVPSGVTSVTALIVGGGGPGVDGDTTTGTYGGAGGAGGAVTYYPGLSVSGSQIVQLGQGGQPGGFDINGNAVTNTSGSPTVFGSISSSGGTAGVQYIALSPPSSSAGTPFYTSGRGGYGARSNSAPSAGNAGIAISITGTTEYYGAGGGAGGGFGFKGTAGGSLKAGSGGDTSTAGTSGAAGYGSGGGGGGFAYGRAGYGGSGTVIIRYFTATKPVFAQPVNANITVGQYETFSVNMAADSATAGLTRTFRWESSTSGINGTWSTIKQGTGYANTYFSWLPADSSTSGNQFLYRVIVSDLDSDGLGLTDTSTAVYATISGAISLIYPSVITKTVGVTKSVTMTASGGSAPLRYSIAPVITFFTLDTSTAGSPILKISDSTTVGTYYETITVTDSNTATLLAPITIIVSSPPTIALGAEAVESGTVLLLDAANTASYPKSGTTWTDVASNSRNANFAYAFGTSQTMADGSVRTVSFQSYVGKTCTTPVYSPTENGAFEFDSTTQCGYIPNVGLLPTYTVEIWVKRNGPQSSGVSQILLANPYRYAADEVNIQVTFYNQTTIKASILSGGVETGTTGLATPDGVWFLVQVTYDGTTLKLMINNDSGQVASTTARANWNTSKLDPGLVFGPGRQGGTNNAYTLKGSIGSIRVYNRVLTSAELTQNYNATKARFLNSSNKVSVAKKWGSTYIDAYTVTSGSETVTATFANTNPLITWDTSTAKSLKLNVNSSLTAGTYLDTITVTDIYGSSTYWPIKIVISAGDTITVSVETATVMTYNGKPATVYPRVVIKGLGGTDTATVQTSFTSLTYTDSLTVPTNADTYTVQGANLTFTSGSLSNYAGVIYETSTLTINKAKQNPLNIFMYGGTVGSAYLIWLQGGNGTGTVTETLTGTASLTGCQISNHYLTAAEQKQGYCEVRVVKAGDQNYYAETSTVQLYFMAYVNNQPTGQVGGGTVIALNGVTSFDTSTVSVPTITGFSTLTLSLSGGGSFTITGTGFTGSVTVKFYRNKVISVTPVDASTITIPVSSIQSAGAVTGRIAVITAAGEGVSDQTLTISP